MPKNKELVFNRILKEIAKEENIEHTSICDGWIHNLKYGNIHRQIYGYKLGLNSDVVSEVCRDKSALSEILLKNNVNCVNHIYIPKPEILGYMNYDKTRYDFIIKNMLEQGTCVVKPNFGTGGRNVYKVNEYDEANEKINIINKNEGCCCISFYEDIQDEIRLVILNKKIELAYKKIRQGSWKHNLSLGASIDIVDINKLDIEIKKLVKKSNEMVDYTVASVDIIKTKNEYKILEINTGLMMERFAQISNENYNIAKKIYKKCINIVMQNKII